MDNSLENIEILDEILLSDNVCENFHEVINNEQFSNWLFGVVPKIKDCIGCEQDNPWHIYNVMDHILHSVEEVNKLSQNLDENTRRILAYTMFFHDVGKPECKFQRLKDGKMIDSFFGHNKASAEIAEKTMNCFGFDAYDSNMIVNFVLDHDDFMSLRSFPIEHRFLMQVNKVWVEKEIDKLNKNINVFKQNKYTEIELMKMLLMVTKADSNAQNPKLTAEPKKVTELIDDFIKEISSAELENRVKD